MAASVQLKIVPEAQDLDDLGPALREQIADFQGLPGLYRPDESLRAYRVSRYIRRGSALAAAVFAGLVVSHRVPLPAGVVLFACATCCVLWLAASHAARRFRAL